MKGSHIISNLTLAISLAILSSSPIQASESVVKIHYLGHASFLLQFDNGISVLTDYGVSRAYGLDSPIHDLGTFRPDIVTYSHKHEDHDRGARFDSAQEVTESESLSVQGIDITPIRTCELSIGREDNASYLFTYKGVTILHLADAQAYIKRIEQEDVRNKVKALYPETYDLLLMTIEGRSKFVPQAEAFIDLLEPKRIIPNALLEQSL